MPSFRVFVHYYICGYGSSFFFDEPFSVLSQKKRFDLYRIPTDRLLISTVK